MGESIGPRKNRTELAELVKKVKDAVNLVEVVGENVVLRKTGANHVGLCPFHSERTPSFSVNEHKQLYHCYGCKKGGDLITFVMEISALSFPEALEELAERARIALPKGFNSDAGEEGPRSEQRRKTQEKLALAHRLNRFSASFFRNSLKNSPEALQYLSLRGVGPEVQEAFYLGATSGAWDALGSYLVQKKAPIELAHELGLVRSSAKGNFDLFRNRVIFPILNIRGKVAGFGGRVLLEQDHPKYLNSPDSLVFQKSKLAFGLYQAQKFIREKDEIVLVEGYFDVLTLYAAGFRNVVATCGTALTLDHLHAFRRLASKLIVVFDGDTAGKSATLRAMETGLDAGWVLHGVKLPEGLDPDEILLDPSTGQFKPDGQAQLTALLEGARPILDTEMEEAIQDGQKDPEAQTQALRKIGKWLSRLNDPLGREVRLEKVQKEFRISRALLLGAMKGEGGGAAISPSSGVNPPPVAQSRLENSKAVLRAKNQGLGKAERILIAGLAKGGEFLQTFLDAQDRLPPGCDLASLFDYPPASEWVRKIGSDIKSLDWSSSDEQIRSVVTETMVSEETSIQLEPFKRAIFRSLAKKWARFSQQISRQIVQSEAKNDAGLQAKLMKEYLDVQRKMKEFNSFYDEE